MRARRIVFKCSFGGSDGWGHVIRSSALASLFRERGWETALWTSSDYSTLPSEVASGFCHYGDEASLLGAEFDPRLLVVDEMYTSDAAFADLESRWRRGAEHRLMVGVDDMQRRSMSVFDLVVNAEIGLKEASYKAKRALLGEEYALLRKGFRGGLKRRTPNTDGGVDDKQVFVMLGGTDAFGYTKRVLENLLVHGGPEWVPTVALGQASEGRRGIVDTLGKFGQSQLLEGADSLALAECMQGCAFGVVACGSSLYELAAVELPFVGLCLVDNQRSLAAKAERLWGMPIVYREGQDKMPLDLSVELRAMQERPKGRYAEVDGRGAQRVFEAICEML